ncbi:MAG: hypothetical protein C3F11_03045 [Methylocystaceae bacterium]|nr:MAG: hypothetical protein C3F11_03045 [Methylocystaceae bacterium]
MSDAYVIEIGEEAVGIIAREPRGFRFYAANGSFRSLEGQIFDSAKKAQNAARELRRHTARASSLSKPLQPNLS